MNTIMTNLAEMPRELELSIASSMVDYSVALGRFQGEDAESFIPIGSGTLVSRNGKFGILTAHHCLHNTEHPDPGIGTGAGDSLMLLLTRGRSVIVESLEAREHQLASPESQGFGPDLTFVELLPGPRLESVKAIGSFWNLDPDRQAEARDFAHLNICIVNAGYPSVDYRTEIDGNNLSHSVKHMAFIGALADGEAFSKDGWDYIESSTNREFCGDLPTTFRGVSGGGIWAVRLHCSKDDGTFRVGDVFLVGVTFYQTGEVHLRRHLRGHYIDSIYEIAWKDRLG